MQFGPFNFYLVLQNLGCSPMIVYLTGNPFVDSGDLLLSKHSRDLSVCNFCTNVHNLIVRIPIMFSKDY